MDKIRWGILGAGRISSWFSTGLAACPEAEKYAVGSSSQEKADDFCRKNGWARGYASYEALLADPAVDAVYIGTPVRYHYEWAKKALEAGKPVLCEKAFTTNAAQAEALCALAREKGLFLMEAVWTKCLPVYRRTRQWLSEGLFGEIQAVDLRFYSKGQRGHRILNPEIAGGALLDLGIYPIMYACTFLGYAPSQIETCAILDPTGVDNMSSIVLRYPGGRFANITTGLAPERIYGAYVQGTKGRLLIEGENFIQATHAEVRGWDGTTIAACDGPFRANGYEFEAEEVMRCLHAGLTESPLAPLEESLAVMRIADECRRQWGLHYRFE